MNWKKVIGWTVAVVALACVVGTNIHNQKALQNTGKKNMYAVLPLSGSISKSGKVEFLEDGDSKFEYVLATIKDGKIVPVEE